MAQRLIIALVAVFVFYASPAYAEYGRTPVTSFDPSVIAIDEAEFLGVKLDGDIVITNRFNNDHALGSVIASGKPSILVLSYYKCDGSCPTLNRDLKGALDNMAGLSGVAPGEDFNLLTLSFDKNDNVDKLRMFHDMLTKDSELPEGWKMAVMKSEEDIKALTESIGFKFFWSARDKTFIHPSVLVFLSPEGRVTRYLYGASLAKTDLNVAVAEARFGTEGLSGKKELSDLFLIACYSYNYKEGKYTLNYPLFIAAGSLVLGFSLTFISMMVFKKKRQGGRGC